MEPQRLCRGVDGKRTSDAGNDLGKPAETAEKVAPIFSIINLDIA
jgi:hypothetical protein